MVINATFILIACISAYLAFFKYRRYNSEASKDEEKKNRLQAIISDLYKEKVDVLSSIQKEQLELDKIRNKRKAEIDEDLNEYKLSLEKQLEDYKQELEKEKTSAETEKEEVLLDYKSEIRNAEAALKEVQDTLSAAVKASLREKEKKEKIDFYKLSLSESDLEDVVRLNNFKTTLHQPVILSKLIWTQYFQKQTNELCNRVLGTQKICGIYKITDVETDTCYIGQSVDVAERFKQHVKKGLGIDASATNKLYKEMQRRGVWNFTFELLETCTREQLNEKEKSWIKIYQSNIFGLNGTGGNN